MPMGNPLFPVLRSVRCLDLVTFCVTVPKFIAFGENVRLAATGTKLNVKTRWFPTSKNGSLSETYRLESPSSASPDGKHKSTALAAPFEAFDGPVPLQPKEVKLPFCPSTRSAVRSPE